MLIHVDLYRYGWNCNMWSTYSLRTSAFLPCPAILLQLFFFYWANHNPWLRGQFPPRPTVLALHCYCVTEAVTKVWLCNPFKGGWLPSTTSQLVGAIQYTNPSKSRTANNRVFIAFKTCSVFRPSDFFDEWSFSFRFDGCMQLNTCPQKFATAQVGFMVSDGSLKITCFSLAPFIVNAQRGPLDLVLCYIK